MIDDVLDIMRSEGRWMTAEEVRDALIWKDPVRYRTTRREYVGRCIHELKKQGYRIDVEYFQEGWAKYARYKFMGVEA